MIQPTYWPSDHWIWSLLQCGSWPNRPGSVEGSSLSSLFIKLSFSPFYFSALTPSVFPEAFSRTYLFSCGEKQEILFSPEDDRNYGWYARFVAVPTHDLVGYENMPFLEKWNFAREHFSSALYFPFSYKLNFFIRFFILFSNHGSFWSTSRLLWLSRKKVIFRTYRSKILEVSLPKVWVKSEDSWYMTSILPWILFIFTFLSLTSFIVPRIRCSWRTSRLCSYS